MAVSTLCQESKKAGPLGDLPSWTWFLPLYSASVSSPGSSVKPPA